VGQGRFWEVLGFSGADPKPWAFELENADFGRLCALEVLFLQMCTTNPSTLNLEPSALDDKP
jgi:hypothetical protein